ncbi:MAG: hypothetical protein ACTSVF_03400, partial [Candidatus Asgardarchaeia archaeon]
FMYVLNAFSMGWSGYASFPARCGWGQQPERLDEADGVPLARASSSMNRGEADIKFHLTRGNLRLETLF